jgi:archaellum biogenesis protein FlaJ (TadC family)
MEKIDEYLPKEYRITKEEYKKALSDNIFRTQILTKIDVALTIIYNQIKPEA